MNIVTILLAIVCAVVMSNFAYANGLQAHRDKWEKLTMIAPISAEPLAHSTLADPPALLFLIASMSFTALAYVYYSGNQNDTFQKTILISGTVLGLLMSLSTDLGILLGIFGLEPWLLLLSLVISDVVHSISVRRQRCEGCVSIQGFGDEKA